MLYPKESLQSLILDGRTLTILWLRFSQDCTSLTSTEDWMEISAWGSWHMPMDGLKWIGKLKTMIIRIITFSLAICTTNPMQKKYFYRLILYFYLTICLLHYIVYKTFRKWWIKIFIFCAWIIVPVQENMFLCQNKLHIHDIFFSLSKLFKQNVI